MDEREVEADSRPPRFAYLMKLQPSILAECATVGCSDYERGIEKYRNGADRALRLVVESRIAREDQRGGRSQSRALASGAGRVLPDRGLQLQRDARAGRRSRAGRDLVFPRAASIQLPAGNHLPESDRIRRSS